MAVRVALATEPQRLRKTKHMNFAIVEATLSLWVPFMLRYRRRRKISVLQTDFDCRLFTQDAINTSSER